VRFTNTNNLWLQVDKWCLWNEYRFGMFWWNLGSFMRLWPRPLLLSQPLVTKNTTRPHSGGGGHISWTLKQASRISLLYRKWFLPALFIYSFVSMVLFLFLYLHMCLFFCFLLLFIQRIWTISICVCEILNTNKIFKKYLKRQASPKSIVDITHCRYCIHYLPPLS